MSSKQNTRVISAVAALSKDVAGNMLSGNEIRAMHYLKALRETLDALQEKMDIGNDVRAERVLDEAIGSINERLYERLDSVPFDGTSVQGSFAKWAKCGFTLPDFLPSMSEEALEQAGEAEETHGQAGKVMGEA